MPSEGAASRPAFVRPQLHEGLLLVLGAILVFRYRWLLDDAFVYFRYVDNWLFTGAGLVMNAGEYVEGYSSPLQFLVLAALRALHLDWMHAVTLLGLAGFVGFGALVVRLNRELSPPGPVFDLPLAYLAGLYGTTAFFTSGLETPWAQLLAPVFALLLLRPRGPWLTGLAALAPLARPELALALALTVVFQWWRARRFPWLLAGLAALFNGAWLVFRIAYYADLLPNTFYLKDDVQWGQGLVYVGDLLRGTGLPLFALALAALMVLGRRRGVAAQPDADLRGGDAAARLAMIGVALAVAAYVVRVGGAALHYWYLAFPFPLLVCASAGLVERATRGASQRALAVGALAIFLVAAAMVPRQLSSHPFFGDEVHTQQGVVGDASFHRHHPTLQPQSWRGRVRIADMQAFAPLLAERGYDRVVTGTWCRTHWAQYRSRVVHGFGLTEPVLARVDTPEIKPGHKPALRRLAEDVAAIRREGSTLTEAAARGDAPEWILRNRAAIETVERKMYNRHDLVENLGLAFTPVPRLRLPE